jgi:hypothetical protein
MAFSQSFIEVDGCKVNLRRGGSGRPLLVRGIGAEYHTFGVNPTFSPPSIQIDTAPARHDNVVEIFNNEGAMATVNFSVPDEVKEQFNRVFARENKSSVVARLMMQAVEERRAQRERVRAVNALLKLRRTRKPLTLKQFNEARRAGRP